MPTLDFARDRAAGHRREKLFWSVLGLVLGLQLGLAAWRLQAVEAALSSLAVQQRQLLGKSAHASGVELSAEQLKSAQNAQVMLGNLAVPWEDLFSAVERASSQRVLIDAIQPRAESGSININISVSSTNFADTAEFVQRLINDGALQDVMLVSEAQSEGSTSTLRAVVTAKWGGPK